MNARKLLIAVSVLLALAVLASCGGQAGAPSQPTTAPSGGGGAPQATSAPSTGGGAAKSVEGSYIPIVSKGFQHQFWQAVKSGAEQAAAQYKVKINFEGPENESQVDKQMEMLQAEFDKHPAAICFAALDSKAAIPLLQKFKSQNIPVVGFDSGVDSDIPVTTAATDNIAAAGEAADHMAQLIGDSGEVAVIVHDQTSRTGIDRRDGFVKRIQEKHPNVKIVDIQYGGGDQLKSTDLAKAIIQAHPNLKGFFGANEGSIIGVLNAVKELKKEGQIVVIGYDSGKQQIDAINSGVEAGAITQNPVGIGQKCVEAAVQALQGQQLPKTIDTGYYWYDKTNINDPKIKAVLYQ